MSSQQRLYGKEDDIFKSALYIGPPKYSSPNLISMLTAMERNIPHYKYLELCVVSNKFWRKCRLYMIYAKMLYNKFLLNKKILHLYSSNGLNWDMKSGLIKFGKLMGYKVIFHSLGGSLDQFTLNHTREHVIDGLNRCDMLWTPSKARLNDVQSKYNFKNILLVPSMVSPLDTNETLPPSPIPVVLFSGEFSHEKGVFDIVECMSKYYPELCDKIRMMMVGSGKGGDLKQAVKDADIEDLVDIFGWLDEDNKAFVINGSDIFLSVSYSEMMPINIIEGMMQGLPVIGTPVGSTPELVTDGVNGYLIPEGDIDKLFDTLMIYVKNPSLIKIHGEEAKKSVERFRPENVKIVIRELYKKLLKK